MLDEGGGCAVVGPLGPGSRVHRLHTFLVPYGGGLRDVQLEPGETVVVCPAGLA